MIIYSESEEKMFTQLGFGYYLKEIEPTVLYRMAIEDCFILNKSDKAVLALRSAACAFLRLLKPYRLTKEFDDLIDVKMNH